MIIDELSKGASEFAVVGYASDDIFIDTLTHDCDVSHMIVPICDFFPCSVALFQQIWLICKL